MARTAAKAHRTVGALLSLGLLCRREGHTPLSERDEPSTCHALPHTCQVGATHVAHACLKGQSHA